MNAFRKKEERNELIALAFPLSHSRFLFLSLRVVGAIIGERSRLPSLSLFRFGLRRVTRRDICLSDASLTLSPVQSGTSSSSSLALELLFDFLYLCLLLATESGRPARTEI